MNSIQDLINNLTNKMNFFNSSNKDLEFLKWINLNLFSEDLLSRYRFNLFQIKEINEENLRLSNLASTRMYRVLQFLDEITVEVDDFYQHLLSFDKLNNSIDAINEQLRELERFLLQTEISMACLEKDF